MRPVNHRASQWGAVSVASQGQCPETRKDSGADPGSHTHITLQVDVDRRVSSLFQVAQLPVF